MMLKSKKILTIDHNNEDRIERKNIEFLIDACSKLNSFCGRRELKVVDLKWQPYYTTVFKQIKTQLECILSHDTTKTLEKLSMNKYFLIMKNQMIVSFCEFSKFIYDNGANIGTATGISRKRFFQYIVHYQFLALELMAYFPDGIYQPSNVKISKPEAKIWWNGYYQNEIIVERKKFMETMKRDFQFSNHAEIISFEKCIDFTKTDYVTTFEFDMITRLFSPWQKFIEVWRIIYNHPGYMHFGTYGETKEVLNNYLDKPGTYVFRASCKDLGFWSIGYVKLSKEMGQIKVDKSTLIDSLVEGKKKNLYLYPNGEINDPDLSKYNALRKEVTVKSDVLNDYASFDEFKECKICREAEKDLMLESCGHQICEKCYQSLRKYDKRKCPFCNQVVQSTTKIINRKPVELKENSASDQYVEVGNDSNKSLPINSENYVSNQEIVGAHADQSIGRSTGDDSFSGLSSIYGAGCNDISLNNNRNRNGSTEADSLYMNSSSMPPAVPPLPASRTRGPGIHYPPIAADNRSKGGCRDSEVYADMSSQRSKKPPLLAPEPVPSNFSIYSSRKIDDTYSFSPSNDGDVYNTFVENEPTPISNNTVDRRQYFPEDNDNNNNTVVVDQLYSHLEPRDEIYCDHIEVIATADGAAVDAKDDDDAADGGAIQCNNIGDVDAVDGDAIEYGVIGDVDVVDSVTANSSEIGLTDWSEDKVQKALKVAQGDQVLARRILEEFFPLE